MGWSRMVSMELTEDEKIDMMFPCIGESDRPDFPYSLKIALTERELEKLELKPDCKPGDVIDLRAFAVVTSVSTEQRDGRDAARVELQIERLSIETDESTESGEDEDDG